MFKNDPLIELLLNVEELKQTNQILMSFCEKCFYFLSEGLRLKSLFLSFREKLFFLLNVFNTKMTKIFVVETVILFENKCEQIFE